MAGYSITKRLSLAARGLRLPFLAASVLPYTYGALFAPRPLSLKRFALGLCAVACAHLSANLMNDYADSRSGVDWRDPVHRGYFGGSKLIQSGLATERTYLISAWAFAGAGLVCAAVLALLLKAPWAIPLFIAAQVLAWSYSARPLQLSYVRLGEVCIFLLFGPACVVAGWVVQTVAWPDSGIIISSLPLGFFTAAILMANEVPDREDDLAAGKHNLANSLPPHLTWLPYLLGSIVGLIVVVWAWAADLAGPWVLLSLAVLIPVIVATRILAKHSEEKSRLMSASKLALVAHACVSLVLIMEAL